jgi:predicted negative regulator of RcsB-dependent stress response
MTTLHSDEANILDAETFNWRLVVYPLLAALVVVVGGFGYYYYLQNQRDQMEAAARDAVVQAKTPEELVKVADQFPKADQATLALLSAADGSFAKHDYASAIQAYQRILQSTTTDPELRDAAQLGQASTQEANGNTNEAITSYLAVAQLGDKSPYAPFAYNAVAHIYEQRNDKDNERQTLTALASLDPDSPFVKQAQYKLKQMNAAAQPPLTIPVPAMPAPAPSTPAAVPASAPVAPAQK